MDALLNVRKDTNLDGVLSDLRKSHQQCREQMTIELSHDWVVAMEFAPHLLEWSNSMLQHLDSLSHLKMPPKYLATLRELSQLVAQMDRPADLPLFISQKLSAICQAQQAGVEMVDSLRSKLDRQQGVRLQRLALKTQETLSKITDSSFINAPSEAAITAVCKEAK